MNNYYLERKERFLNFFQGWIQNFKTILIASEGQETAEEIVEQAIKQFEAMLPELPYIGGDSNPLTNNFVAYIRWVPVFKVLKGYNKTPEEMGKLIYDDFKLNTSRIPVEELARIREKTFSEEHLTQQRSLAEQSQKKEYPGDWVYSVVEGDGEEFDYGYDYSECALEKFFRAQGMLEMLPFVCMSDFYDSQLVGIGLHRNKTLADGDHVCNFRYKQGRDTVYQGDLHKLDFVREALK